MLIQTKTAVNADRARIAATIHAQLGGARFDIMTGAYRFLMHDAGLAFSLPRAACSIRRVRITLEANDTYSVLFAKSNGSPVAQCAGLTCETLLNAFETYTCLRTSL